MTGMWDSSSTAWVDPNPPPDELGRSATAGEIVAGVFLSMAGTFCSSVANILVKWDHDKHNDALPEEQRPCWRRPVWYLIFILYIVGGVFDFAAYGLAPLSLLAPVASVTIVMNALLAYFAFGEKLTYRDLVGSVIVILAAGTATSVGSRASAIIDLDGLLILWRAEVWLAFMSCELLAMFAAYVLVHVLDPAWPGFAIWWRAYRMVHCRCANGWCIDPSDRDVALIDDKLPATADSSSTAPIDAGTSSTPKTLDADSPVDDPTSPGGSVVAPSVAAALADVAAGKPLTPLAAMALTGRQSVPTGSTAQSIHAFRAVMYAFLTASAGAWTNILGKCCSELMRETADGNNQWNRGESWAMLLALPFFAVMQLRFMSEMMAIFEAVLIVPIYQCVFMIWLIVCGQVYFQEFDTLPMTNIGIFIGAVVVCGFGVLILTRRPPPTEAQVQEQKEKRLAASAARREKRKAKAAAAAAASGISTNADGSRKFTSLNGNDSGAVVTSASSNADLSAASTPVATSFVPAASAGEHKSEPSIAGAAGVAVAAVPIIPTAAGPAPVEKARLLHAEDDRS